MNKKIYNHLYSALKEGQGGGHTRVNLKALSKAKPEKFESQSIHNHILDYNSNNNYRNCFILVKMGK